VPTKAPLLEEAIFKRNQAVAERRQAARKEQHKEQEITKRDRNDNRINHRKAGEPNVSFDEDLSPPSAWSRDEPSVATDWSDMSGSPSPSPRQAVEVSLSRRPELATREKGAGSSSQSRARPIREDQRVIRSHTMPGVPCASERRRDPPHRDDPPKRPAEHKPSPCHLFDGSDHLEVDAHVNKDEESVARTTSSVGWFGRAARSTNSFFPATTVSPLDVVVHSCLFLLFEIYGQCIPCPEQTLAESGRRRVRAVGELRAERAQLEM
jgi:hypothetical protein